MGSLRSLLLPLLVVLLLRWTVDVQGVSSEARMGAAWSVGGQPAASPELGTV